MVGYCRRKYMVVDFLTVHIYFVVPYGSDKQGCLSGFLFQYKGFPEPGVLHFVGAFRGIIGFVGADPFGCPFVL